MSKLAIKTLPFTPCTSLTETAFRQRFTSIRILDENKTTAPATITALTQQQQHHANSPLMTAEPHGDSIPTTKKDPNPQAPSAFVCAHKTTRSGLVLWAGRIRLPMFHTDRLVREDGGPFMPFGIGREWISQGK